MREVLMIPSFIVAIISAALVVWDIHRESRNKKIAIVITALSSLAILLVYVVGEAMLV